MINRGNTTEDKDATREDAEDRSVSSRLYSGCLLTHPIEVTMNAMDQGNARVRTKTRQ